MHAGLLRPDARISRILQYQTFEWGIGIGLFLGLAGVIYFIYAILEWGKIGFGPLSYPESLRVVIPSLTAIALGVQCVFSGFALAVLGLAYKK